MTHLLHEEGGREGRRVEGKKGGREEGREKNIYHNYACVRVKKEGSHVVPRHSRGSPLNAYYIV